MKNLKRALKYLAVWAEPVVPADDMGPAHTLSYAEENTESEARERARKHRKRRDKSCLEKAISAFPGACKRE